MSSDAFVRFSRWAIAAIAAATVIGCVAWIMSAPVAFDDYIYLTEFSGDHDLMVLDSLGADVTTPAMAINSAINHYGSENGRLANILHILWNPAGRTAEALFSGLMIFLMWLMMIMWGRDRRRLPSLGAVIAATWLLWCAFPWYDFMQALDFQANYVWPSVMMLAVMALVISDDRKPLSLPATFATAFLAFLTGWMHESFAFTLIAWLFFHAIVAPSRLRDPRLWTVMAFLITGTLVNLFGGTLTRASEADATSGITRLSTIAKQLVIQLWPFILAVILAAVAWVKGHRHRVTAIYIPLLAASAVTIAMAVALGKTDRVLWPMDLLCSLVIISQASRISLSRRPLATTYAVTLLFIAYCLWLHSLITTQQAVTAQCEEVDRQLSPRTKGRPTVAYADYTPDTAIPFYLMGITANPLQNGWNSECQGSYHHLGHASTLILPPDHQGRTFEEWDDIPGHNNLKGRWPMIATRDTSATTMTVTFDTPRLTKMSPLNIAYLIMSGKSLTEPSQARVDLAYQPVILPDGDTVYRVFPALPRYTHHRHFLTATE